MAFEPRSDALAALCSFGDRLHKARRGPVGRNMREARATMPAACVHGAACARARRMLQWMHAHDRQEGSMDFSGAAMRRLRTPFLAAALVVSSVSRGALTGKDPQLRGRNGQLVGPGVEEERPIQGRDPLIETLLSARGLPRLQGAARGGGTLRSTSGRTCGAVVMSANVRCRNGRAADARANRSRNQGDNAGRAYGP